MKIEVKGTPEEVLDKIGVFLSLEFPHKGVYRRDETRVSFSQHVNEGTLLGLVGLVLTVLTVGMFLIVWALLMIDRYLSRSWVEARVERADDQHTVITTSGT